MLYAEVNDEKRMAEPGLAGLCPGCRAPMVPKCGSLKEWHWAHKAGSDCDPWSEPIGPWHLSWQTPLRSEHVEVPRQPHRADIMGNAGVVIELQHSSISPEEIQRRETFYGNMVWLFDATFRFRVVRSDDMAFFAFGRTRHIAACRRPVFLDFGHILVQVERFTDRFPDCSGVGYARNRDWFVTEYLADCLREGARVIPIPSDDEPKANPWENRCPYYSIKHPTRWIESSTGEQRLVPAGAKCMPLNWVWKAAGKNRPFFHDIIDQFPDLCLGWTKPELQAMLDLLSGTAVMFEGRLRVMPQTPDKMRVRMTVSTAAALLKQAEEHIRAGRVPVLRDETKAKIIQLAEHYEIEQYGKVVSGHAKPKGQAVMERSLFD
ncbi:MAG: competence protein CoiA [Thermoguttaceae bacterium]